MLKYWNGLPQARKMSRMFYQHVKFISASRALQLGTMFTLVLLCGCRSMYFDAVEPPAEPLQYSVESLPIHEYWTGIVFNGEKIGFSHLKLTPRHEGWRIESRAALRFRLLGYDKNIVLEASDDVGLDLQLQRFQYRYDLDGNLLELSGERHGDQLITLVTQAGRKESVTHAVQGKLWPSSVIQLKPVLDGLAPGRSNKYQVFDGETQAIAEVSQSVEAFERSELFSGPAWRITTRLHGQRVSSWINQDGLPELEMSLGGVLIAHLEDAKTARDYLLRASLNKQETLLDFSLIKLSEPLQSPRELTELRINVSGLPGEFVPSAGSGQHCDRIGGANWQCLISGQLVTPDQYEPGIHLAASQPIPTNSVVISALVTRVQANSETTDIAELMLDWVHDNIEPVAEDSFSALDVLSNGRGECQGQSNLLTAMLRNARIPARVVNGLVYSDELRAFAWHAWVEAWLDGHWQAMDPIFGQRRADATHLRLLEGETTAELLPLLNLIGRVRLELADS